MRIWNSALTAMNSEWLNLTFTSNHLSPIGTQANDTLKYLLQQSGAAFGLHDLSTDGPNAIRNAGDFFLDVSKREKYHEGFVTDQILGRQINSYTHKRTFSGNYLDIAMAECPQSLIALCNTLVTKVLFADQGDTLSTHATGVEYVEGMDAYELSFNHNRDVANAAPRKKAYARKGIILGGGAFNSPQMLMLSGIGTQSHLEQFDIPVRKHLPAVGANLQDDNENTVHFAVLASGDPRAVNNTLDSAFGTRPYFVPSLIKSYFGTDSSRFDPTIGVPINFPVAFDTFCHAGAVAFGGRACPIIQNSSHVIFDDPSYLSSFTGDGRSFYHDTAIAGHSNVMTYFSTPQEKLDRKNPTCMAICVSGAYIKGWYDTFFHYGGAVGSLMACDVLTTALHSRGSIQLRSSSPFEPPIIDTNAFSVAEDLIHSGNCVNELRKIMDTANQLSAANPTEYGGMYLAEYTSAFSAPGPSVSKTEVTPELEEWLKKSLWHHHPSSSNRMGNINEANSVVDSRGRVWGTANLYVVDVSAQAAHSDHFPSVNAMTFGYLQAESLVTHHTQAINRVCNVRSFLGAQPENSFDNGENPLKTPTIVLAVFLGVTVLALTITGVAWFATRSTGGYTVINSDISSKRRR